MKFQRTLQAIGSDTSVAGAELNSSETADATSITVTGKIDIESAVEGHGDGDFKARSHMMPQLNQWVARG